MTKRVRSDGRPCDVRPVSLMNPDAPDTMSRYEQVSRQFAQEFPQMAWGLGQRPWISWFLSSGTGRQGNKNTAPADDGDGATAAGPSSIGGSDADSEFVTSAKHNPPMYNDDAYFDALYIAMTMSASSPATQTGDPASPTAPDAGFDPSCDLEALALRLLWQIQMQELRYRRAMRNANEEQAMPSERDFAQPVERREPREFESRAPVGRIPRVGGDRLNRIKIELGKLGSRLREDARKQLDVISDDNAALPLCL
ncbi:hypothetical protein J3F83DRAFT_642180 [Trichoderma novae-zelandiae]